MIEVKNLTKKMGQSVILNNISCTINDGCVYGLIGANGAGKSTLLRLLTGVYKKDSGEILVDGEPVYENISAKKKIAYVPDDLYFISGANLNRMEKLYASLFPDFSHERYKELLDVFKLDPKKQIATFSKGMRRQGAILLALSCRTKYIFFDETFDGLDPVMRNVVKRIIASDVLERNATAIITSHSLRELEDTCDQLSLLHNGGIVFESDIQNLKTNMFKIQIGLDREYDKSLFDGLDVISFVKHGSVSTLIVRDKDCMEKLKSLSPILLEALPLTLEEVFIYETEALGYSFNDIIK